MRGFDLSAPAPGDLDAVALQTCLQQRQAYVATSSDLWDWARRQRFFRRQDAHVVVLYHRDDGAPLLRLYFWGIGWRPSPTQLAWCVVLQLEVYVLVR